MRRRYPVAAAAAAFALCVGAPVALAGKPLTASTPDAAHLFPPAVVELQKAALKDTRAYDTLSSLTSEVGNRSAGSDGDRKAVEWALRTLRAQGFANVHSEPVTVPRWIRGSATVEVVGLPELELPVLALGGSIGTDGVAVEGEVVTATTIDELKALSRERVAGRIVFLDDRMTAARDGMDYGPTVRNRAQGAIEAAKLGAVGVVIRAVGTDGQDRPHTGAMRYANGVPRLPAFSVGDVGADKLLALYAHGPLKLRLTSTARCDGTAESANVVGEIPGRATLERGAAEEFVLLAAHLDSWDVGTGAQDDGAGVVTMMEAARRVGELKQRPRRTIRVVLFANEEFGLSGGHRYALDHAGEIPRHAAAIEADLGAGRVYQFESKVTADDVTGAMRLTDLLAPLGLRYASNETGGGADVGPLRERGVPVFELQHDATHYFEIHHTQADTLDKVQSKDLAFNVAAYATLVWALADREQRFAPLSRTWPAPQESVNPCEWQP